MNKTISQRIASISVRDRRLILAYLQYHDQVESVMTAAIQAALLEVSRYSPYLTRAT
jgi:hypothetical protein